MSPFQMYWKRTLKKPGSILAWLALPFVFMTIYEFAFGGQSSGPTAGLAIIDNDQSFASGAVSNAFTQGPMSGMLDVRDARDEAELEELFSDGTASVGLVIPPDFQSDLLAQKPVTLTMYTNPRHYIGPQIAGGAVEVLVTLGNGALTLFEEPLSMISASIATGAPLQVDSVGAISRSFYATGSAASNALGILESDVTIVEKDSGEEQDFNMVALFFPGLIMFALLSVSLTLEWRFMNDRVTKINDRLVTTPIKPMTLVLHQRFYLMSFLYVIGITTAAIGAVVWRVPAYGLMQANLIAIAMVIFLSGVNGIIFGMTNSIKAASAINSVVMMILMLFGGGFFPVESMPIAIQGFSRLTPTGLANIGLTQSLSGRELTISIPLLFGYSFVFLALAIYLGRKRLVAVS